jgi:lycopene cyclase domain-containing protein
MSLYLALDLAVAFFPVVLSFHRRVRFLPRWPAAVLSALAAGVPFAAWDAVMAARGAWSFSTRFAGPHRILGLPPAELLFFLVVPFACLFIGEVVAAYTRDRRWTARRWPWLLAAAACAALAVPAWPRLYTATVLAAAALFFLLAALLAPGMLAGSRFWISLLFTYVPFLLSNGVLTALPVVSYAPGAILGPRAYTIPVEDFLYSFVLIGSSSLAYHFLRDRLPPSRAVLDGRTPAMYRSRGEKPAQRRPGPRHQSTC